MFTHHCKGEGFRATFGMAISLSHFSFPDKKREGRNQ